MDDRMIHCPCCGAPVTGNTCEYCGCVIYDFADINLDGKPSYIRINTDMGIFCGKVVASSESSIEFREEEINITGFAGNVVSSFVKSRSCRISLSLDCVVDDDKLFYVVPKDRPYKTALDDWA